MSTSTVGLILIALFVAAQAQPGSGPETPLPRGRCPVSSCDPSAPGLPSFSIQRPDTSFYIRGLHLSATPLQPHGGTTTGASISYDISVIREEQNPTAMGVCSTHRSPFIVEPPVVLSNLDLALACCDSQITHYETDSTIHADVTTTITHPDHPQFIARVFFKTRSNRNPYSLYWAYSKAFVSFEIENWSWVDSPLSSYLKVFSSHSST